METTKRGRRSQDKVKRTYTIDRETAEYIDSLIDGDRSRFVSAILKAATKREMLVTSPQES